MSQKIVIFFFANLPSRGPEFITFPKSLLLLLPGTLMDCYDELGNRYQLPVYVLSAPTNLIEELSESDNGQDTDNSSPGIEIPIKFRLSHTNKDIKMPVRTTDSVYKIKKRICEDEGIEVVRQRFFYSGRLLNDKLRIEDAKVPKGHVIQVIVTKKEEDL